MAKPHLQLIHPSLLAARLTPSTNVGKWKPYSISFMPNMHYACQRVSVRMTLHCLLSVGSPRSMRSCKVSTMVGVQLKTSWLCLKLLLLLLTRRDLRLQLLL